MKGAPGEARVDGGAIAIVGIGARFAGARDLQEVWKVTVEGRDAFGPVPANRWDFEAFYDPNPRSRDKSYAPTGAFIDDVKSFPAVTLQIPPRRVEVMDPQQRFALECCLEAVEDSGRSPGEMPHRTGVYMGVTAVEFRTLTAARVSAQLMATGKFGAAPEDLEALGRAVENVLAVRPFSAPGVLSNMIAATVAQELGLHGPAYTMDAACASGLVAVSAAVDALRTGQTDAALAGGVYLCLTPEHHIAFSRIGAISKSGVCRPFDTRADGFVQGDGCGVVMLKRHADALRDGDRVYGVIHGIGMNNDGGGTGPMAPVKEGQVEVVRTAWERAMAGGVDPADLGYVETHGTGTHVGDKIEFDGLCDAIGAAVKHAALGSSKANFGHTMSAAGILGLIRATLALHHETVPPMAGFESHKEDLELERSAFTIPKVATPWTGPGRLATVSSFGFGGTNVHVVLGAADTRAPVAAQVELVRMSAADLDALKDLAGRTARALEANPKATVAGVARAWAKRREQATRVGVVAGTVAELAAKLAAFSRGEIGDGVVVGTAPAAGEPAPRVGFMYPGQGAQRLGMIGGIKARFPVVAATFDALDGASAGELARPVQEYLYPERRAGGFDAEAATAELTDTQHCQPALLAVGVALTRLLAQVGVRPAVVAGHSVGEFTAAVTAGILTAEDGLRWTARRGAAMAAISGDPGAMAAIVADRATVASLLVPGAVIANVNHPRQVVVSGASDAVAAVVRAAEARELKAVPLRVSHGFHSAVFDDLDLDAVVDALPMSDGAIPVASCIASAPYTLAASAREVFKRHATSPVLWTDALQQMKAAGADLFVEVSAGGPLVTFARGTFPELGQSVIPLASNADDDGGASLLAGLAQLWVRGVALDLAAVTGPAQVASVPPTVLPREDYWPITDVAITKVALASGTAQPAGATPAPVDAPADKAAAPKVAAVEDEVYNAVMAAVARASAYPRDALRAEMRLRDDLGFDSMMVADLAEDLTKTIPGFTGIPQEVLVNQPSILDIIDFARNPTTGAAGGGNDDAPLMRFGLRWVEAPLPTWGARDLAGGALLAVGEVPEPLLAAFAAQGYTRVTDGPADLVLYVAPMEAPTPVRAVLAGEATAPDYAADLIAVLDAQARAGARPDVLVVRRDSDPWSEGLSGVCRTVAREWPEVIAKAVRVEVIEPERLVDEVRSFDRSVDVRWCNGARLVPGTALLPVAEPWMPVPSDVVAITGGTRGIGLALGKRLAEGGTTVLLVGRSAPEPAISGDNIRWVRADVTDRAAIKRALWGQSVTTLVHSVGFLADGALGTVDPSRGRIAREVKVEGFLNAVAGAGPGLKRVVAIGSWAGRFGSAHQAHYAAANALMAEIATHLPEHLQVAVPEFGPWTGSEMAKSIPTAVQRAMRAEGVDFVSDDVGQLALLEELGDGRGVIVRGRRVAGTTRRGYRTELLAADTHPFLVDHAIGGVPIFPLASAATAIAEVAGVRAPFELVNLTLFQGVAVQEPLSIEIITNGERGEIRQGPKRTLSYRAEVRELRERPLAPEPGTGGEAPTGLSLADFYATATFHGPLLQGIRSIDAIGDGFIRGHVKTCRPADWVPGTEQPAWAIDPLAFDSAMQLAGYYGFARVGRAGTPIGFERLVGLRPWPAAALVSAEVLISEPEADRFKADIIFREASGAVIALVYGVEAELRKVEVEEVPEEEPFEVKPEWTDVKQWKGYKDLALRLYGVEAVGLKNPYFDLHEGTARNTTQIAGREIINYSSYNYLGLSGDERVIEAVYAGMKRYGTSVSASRVASGERPFHHELELALAHAQGVEDAVVMAGGHATNINTIGHLFNPKDLVLHDEFIHDSCIQGIKLSGAARRSFKHEDIGHLEAQLKELRRHYEKVLILVEGVYSMDGDIANLPEYLRLKRAYGCMLMVDEAHSFGTIGSTGYGVGQYWRERGFDFDPLEVDLWMGTMSKSLAAMGGWIAGRKELIQYLRYTTPGFVFAAGVPPQLAIASLTAIRLWSEETWRVEHLHTNCRRFYELCQERGIDNGPAKGESPVVPVITGDSMHALKLSQRLLEEHSINAKPIIFPAVANDAARLRFFLTTLHTDEQLVFTADKIAETLADIRAQAAVKKKR